MEIFLAPYAGFCSGVDRAFKIALGIAAKEKPVYLLGDIVHNSVVVTRLEEQGIQRIKNISELKNLPRGTVIIRTHGAPPEVFTAVKKLGFKLVDATCPIVRKVQQLAQQLKNQGYQVVIVGEKNHPEIQGVLGWVDGAAIVIEEAADVFKIKKGERVGVVVQTTQSLDKFKAIEEAILKCTQDVKIENTICNAIAKSQKSAVELAGKVDLMLVIGDPKSANTKRLAELCEEKVTTHRIETAAELKNQWFANKSKVGVTAGTSTPQWIIDDVICTLKNLKSK